MNFYCKECEESFPTETALHRHFRSHGLKIEDYYVKHYPKEDLYSGKPIKFKSKKQYLSDCFNRRDNMRKWFSSEKVDKVDKIEVLRSLFEPLKETREKGLTTVELKTKKLPSYNDVQGFLSTSEFYDAMGLPKPFDFKKKVNLQDGLVDFYIDTREQDPLFFPSFSILKLDTGDYGCKPPFYSNLFIERKSLQDLVGTLGMGYDRFEKEVQRGVDLGNYLVVMVEAPIEDLIDHRPNLRFKQKASAGFLTKRMRDLIQNYDNVQFVFVDDRNESAAFIEEVFRMKEVAKSIDLQYYYNTK